jgi:DNA-binding transcriptional LysR family regulator
MMIARKLPSLTALRAFEASARHQSFTLASQELCVTQGAISHQVKALEDELGLMLFERLSNRLRLTAVGMRYLDVIREAFDRIESGTTSLYKRRGEQSLVISTSPNFAAKWLAPRLGLFSPQFNPSTRRTAPCWNPATTCRLVGPPSRICRLLSPSIACRLRYYGFSSTCTSTSSISAKK